VKDSEQNWTPVVRKRKTKRGKTMHTKESTSTSSSDSELDVGTARQVYYQECGKVPGLYVRRGCTSSSGGFRGGKGGANAPPFGGE